MACKRSGVRVSVAPLVFPVQSHISTVMPVSEGVPRPDRISSSLAVCAGQRHHRSPCAVSKRSGILSGISAGQRAFPAPPGTRCPSSRTSCSCSSSRRRAVRPPRHFWNDGTAVPPTSTAPTSQETIRAQVAATLDWRQPRGERYAELASITAARAHRQQAPRHHVPDDQLLHPGPAHAQRGADRLSRLRATAPCSSTRRCSSARLLSSWTAPPRSSRAERTPLLARNRATRPDVPGGSAATP